MPSKKKIHQFDNGVKVYDHHLLDIQRKRYTIKNVHEAEEEDLFIQIINQLPPNAIYVNIGSAIGYYPMLARQLRKDILIYCFEPLTRHIIQFKENLCLNQMDEKSFTIYNKAVSDVNATVSFVDESFGSTIIKYAYEPYSIRHLKNIIKRNIGHSKGTIQKVAAIPLSHVFLLASSTTIDFVQMDIQGFEQLVLEQYFKDIQQQSNIITSFLIGTHGNTIHNTCIKLLAKNQYKLLVNEPVLKNQPDGIIHCISKIV